MTSFEKSASLREIFKMDSLLEKVVKSVSGVVGDLDPKRKLKRERVSVFRLST